MPALAAASLASAAFNAFVLAGLSIGGCIALERSAAVTAALDSRLSHP